MSRSIKVAIIIAICVIGGFATTAKADNLVNNGNFEQGISNKVDLLGFMIDFAWMDKHPWHRNHEFIVIKAKDDSKKNVVVLGPGKPSEEPTLVSDPIPYKYGEKYTLTFDGKSTGAGSRVYVRGYKWKPGIRPHKNASLKELRDVFHGNNIEGFGHNWKHFTQPFPVLSYKKMSKLQIKIMKKMRFIAFFATIPEGSSGGPNPQLFFDNIKIVRK